jgi:hypothetical protein
VITTSPGFSTQNIYRFALLRLDDNILEYEYDWLANGRLSGFQLKPWRHANISALELRSSSGTNKKTLPRIYL